MQQLLWVTMTKKRKKKNCLCVTHKCNKITNKITNKCKFFLSDKLFKPRSREVSVVQKTLKKASNFFDSGKKKRKENLVKLNSVLFSFVC